MTTETLDSWIAAAAVASVVVAFVVVKLLDRTQGVAADEDVEEASLVLDLPDPPPTPPQQDARGRWHDPHTHRFVARPGTTPRARPRRKTKLVVVTPAPASLPAPPQD